MESQIRVLVADDHAVVRSALARVLGVEPDIEVVGEACNGREAIQLTQQLTPDVLIMDVSMEPISGTEATRAITARYPRVKVVGLSIHEGSWMASAMHQAGAVAYIEKAAPLENLVTAIRDAVGEQFASRAMDSNAAFNPNLE